MRGELFDETRSGDDRRGVDQMNKRLAMMMSIVSLVTSVFLAGYYWRQLGDVINAQATFQRKDNADLQYGNVLIQLDLLRQQVAQLQVSVDRSRTRKD